MPARTIFVLISTELVYAFVEAGTAYLRLRGSAFYREAKMEAEQPARLTVELDYYGQHAREWVALKAGQYVVIKNKEVLGFYRDFEAAYRAGAATYGLETDFLVKQILEYEPVFIVV